MKGNGGGTSHFHSEAAFEEFLSEMFMGGGGGPSFFSGRGHKAKDAVTEIEVTLEELYEGKQVKMMSKRKIVCPTCKGCVIHLQR